MALSTSKTFDLLDFLSFSLSEYLQSKMPFLEVQMISATNQNGHFDIVLDFAMSFLEFVKKMLICNGIKKPAIHLVQVLESNFLNDIAIISNPKENQQEEKPFAKFLRTKLGKTAAFKFQMLTRLLLLRNLFEGEMSVKDHGSTSTKQKVKKELLKLIDMVRISMQSEDESFSDFYLKKIFVWVKDSNSLNFHNFLIDLCRLCEFPEEIQEVCKENLDKLKQKGKDKPVPQRIPENILSSTILPPTEFERTMSTLNDDAFKFSFPTSLSNFIEKEYSENTKVIPETLAKVQKKPDSPVKSSFAIDPTRKKMFSDIVTNNQKNLAQQSKSQNNTIVFNNPQIQEESDSRSSSMVSIISINHNNINNINNIENVNRNLNNNMVFAKPKMGRNFGTTFGRKVVQLPVVKKNCGEYAKKKNSIFDHFILEVQEKIMDRQLNKDTCSFLQKTFNIRSNDDDASSDLPDLMSWNNVLAYNTPIKERDDLKNRNFDDLEVRSFKAV